MTERNHLRTVGGVMLLVLLSGGTFVTAQDEKLEHALILGRSIVMNTEHDIRRMAIGNPGLVSVVVIGRREILINANSLGRTNLLIWYTDGEREERFLVVEQDLDLLRERLGRIDKSIRVQTSSDGQAIILRGSVETYSLMQAAIDMAASFIEGASTQSETGIVVQDPVPIEDLPEEIQQPPTPGEDLTQFTPGRVSTRVRNLLVVRQLPKTLDHRLAETVKDFSRDIRVRRIQSGITPDDTKDSFVLEGTIRDQHALTRMLSVLDKMIGGGGTGFSVVADEGGGLRSGGGGGAGGNNLSSNIGRASIVRNGDGRLVSFVKVINIPQVLVTVRLLELDRTKAKDIGFNWDLLKTDYDVNTPSPGSTFPEYSDALSIVNGLLDNTVTIINDRYTLTSTIRLLETNGYLRTLAEPNLMAMSGETASFLVGGEVPVLQTTSTTTAALEGFTFRTFGISLTIRPVVGEDGTITIDITPDISSVPTISNQGAPTFKRTNLKTSARLKSDQGIVLGGLISTDEQESVSQIPILGDIPLIGALFRKTTKSKREREVALVLLPKIVMPKPATAFALEMPPPDLRIRAGTFMDPKLGELPSIPRFYHQNIAEGRWSTEER